MPPSPMAHAAGAGAAGADRGPAAAGRQRLAPPHRSASRQQLRDPIHSDEILRASRRLIGIRAAYGSQMGDAEFPGTAQYRQIVIDKQGALRIERFSLTKARPEF